MQAPVIEKRFHDANPVAKLNRQQFDASRVTAISVSGGPGCGKTSLIETSINRLKPDVRVGVVACDIGSHLDADRIKRVSDQVVQVNTGPQGVPDATNIRDALGWLDLEKIDLLFIENIGTLVCTNPTDFGQDTSVAMFSVAGGHDKANKHPEIVQSSSVVVLNKTDLLHAVPFDLAAFRADVARLNASAQLFELSALNGGGMDHWINWLSGRINKHQCRTSHWFG